jgi:pectin lyase
MQAILQTSLIGRQHYVFGFDPSTRITLSNNFINGQTSYSASCDGHQYWAMELVGDDDQITFKGMRFLQPSVTLSHSTDTCSGNYVYYTSGRSPALSGTTLFHACNNVWEDNSGHAIEGDTNGMGLFEGNAFINVNVIASTDTFTAGQLFSSPDDTTNAQCESYIGRSCVTNIIENSGTFDFTDTDFMSNFSGLTVADCGSASDAESSVPTSAGNTL